MVNNMIDEQKLRELADQFICHPVSRSITEVEEGGEAIKELLDEIATLRQERTAWRVTAENAEEKKTQLQEFSKLACRALDDCSRVLTTIDGESMHEQDQIDELNARVTNLAVQALVLNGLIHRGQLEEAP